VKKSLSSIGRTESCDLISSACSGFEKQAMPVFYNKNICHGGQRLLRKQITSQPATGLSVTPSDSLRAAAVGWRVCPKPPTQCWVSTPTRPPGPTLSTF
jgi:hypothetical protein